MTLCPILIGKSCASTHPSENEQRRRSLSIRSFFSPLYCSSLSLFHLPRRPSVYPRVSFIFPDALRILSSFSLTLVIPKVRLSSPEALGTSSSYLSEKLKRERRKISIQIAPGREKKFPRVIFQTSETVARTYPINETIKSQFCAFQRSIQ